ncbi:phospholipase-like protein [Tanacetum coccineum]
MHALYSQQVVSKPVLREVIHETTTVGLWLKFDSLYMTKSLVNKLRLKDHLYTLRMKPRTPVQDHLDEFYTILIDLENLDVDIDNEDKAYDDDVEPESAEGLVARGRRSDRACVTDMSFVEDVIIPIEQSNAITSIEESNASNHILTNLTDPTEDALKVYDAKVTIRSSLNWLHIFRDNHDNHLLNHILQHQREVEFKSKEDTLKFDIAGHTLELGRIEFSLLTSFSIGKYKRPKGVSYDVKGLEQLDFVKDDEKWKNISDVDAVRVCLLLMAEHVFMGQRQIMLWEANYDVRILETFPNNQRWCLKVDNVFPRCLAWGDTNNRFEKQNYGELLGEGSNPKVRLTATPDETNQEWWKRLHEYLDVSLSAYENVKNSENERGEYADLDNGVSSGADAGESGGEETVDEDKHSMRDLELERLLRQVESRLQTVEMESTKLKEEFTFLRKEADDLYTMALDEDAKVCTDEPKPSTTLHSFIPADGVQFMMLDEDAKDTGAEYMNEELRNRSQKKEPLSKQPYVPFCMHTHSRDYQPLDKQPEDKLVQDTAVVDETADKQVVDAKTIKMIKVEQEESGRDVIRRKKRQRKPGPTQITPFTQLKRKRRKKRKIGVISPAVIGDCGEISLTDVTEQQPDTTKPPLVKRRSNRINGAFKQAVIGDDCEKIPLTAWTEIRPAGAPKSKPVVPMEIVEFLRSDGNQKFSFPWVEKNFEVDKQFWSRLLGLHPHRNCWLMDWHLDLWIRYMWRTRLDSANWAMCSAIFCPHILGKELPSSYNVTDTLFPKGWWDVEKVYFPLNERNIHWSLAELHISSGIITFYDSLGPGKEPEERDWWVNLRKFLSLKIPALMTLHGVFRKKDIDPKHYTITFSQAQNAPRQGLNYGDCGVWVCILLYRLSCNISLEVRDHVHTALAYREQLTAFFGSTSMRIIDGRSRQFSSELLKPSAADFRDSFEAIIKV